MTHLFSFNQLKDKQDKEKIINCYKTENSFLNQFYRDYVNVPSSVSDK